MRDKVELRSAYTWTCEECGQDNFCQGVIFEFDEETERELREEHGVDPDDTGEFITIPDMVVCDHCGEEFDTLDYRADDND